MKENTHTYDTKRKRVVTHSSDFFYNYAITSFSRRLIYNRRDHRYL